MPCKFWSIPLLVVLAFGATASKSPASPVAGALIAKEAVNQPDARLDRVAARHCWWEEMLRENRAGNPGGGGRN